MLPYASTPESLGISSAGILRYLDAVKATGQEIHGFLLLRHGQVACEMAWAPYDTVSPHMLFSLSKSFTSTAAGFAVAEGLIKLTDTVGALLPDKLPENPSEWLRSITVSDLLSMSSGLDPQSDSTDPGEDWAKHALSFPVLHAPGTHFHYNSMSTYLVSEIVQRKAGQCIRDYLMPRLFAPLGIAQPEWAESPSGVNAGGWGLSLCTRDIAKFGQLLLQNGVWEGKRILPEGWVETATTKKVDNSHHGGSPDWQAGYCYQFWRCRGGHYRGDGMFGQICLVMPSLDAVVAITAGIQDMGKEMDLLFDHLLPAMDAPAATAEEQKALRARIKGLAYPVPAAGEAPRQDVSGHYAAESGEKLEIAFEGSDLLITFTPKEDMRPAVTARYGLGTLRPSDTDIEIPFGPALPYMAAYGWRGDSLHAVLRLKNAPHTRITTLRFEGDTLHETATGAGLGHDPITYTRQAPCKPA